MFAVAGGSSFGMGVEGLERSAIRSLKHGERAAGAHTTTYVAFDNSKEKLAVAIAVDRPRAEVRFWGTIPNQVNAVRKLVERLAEKRPTCPYALHRVRSEEST